VTVVGLRALPSGADVPLQDSESINPGHTFRFAYGAYGYALDTKGMALGTYELSFQAAGDALVQKVRFSVVR